MAFSSVASSLSARARVLAGYRNLTRARIHLFKGDTYAMNETRKQLKQQFEINKNIPTSGPAFEELLQGMDEAAHMLRHEIVRGNLNENTGRYGELRTPVWLIYDVVKYEHGFYFQGCFADINRYFSTCGGTPFCSNRGQNQTRTCPGIC